MGSPSLPSSRREKPRRANSLAGLQKPGARDRARTGDPHVGNRRRGRGNTATCALVSGEQRRGAAYRGTGDGRRHPGGTCPGRMGTRPAPLRWVEESRSNTEKRKGRPTGRPHIAQNLGAPYRRHGRRGIRPPAPPSTPGHGQERGNLSRSDPAVPIWAFRPQIRAKNALSQGTEPPFCR